MLSKYGTEQVGISAEVALADLTGVSISEAYRTRSRDELVRHIKPSLSRLIKSIPKPIEHIAEDKSPVDFLLEGEKTLSVKSNMRKAGKVAPQNIGQPTAVTFWSRLPHLVPLGVEIGTLSYRESAGVFKQVAQDSIENLLVKYWENLFDCDYTVYVYNVVDDQDRLTVEPFVILFNKTESPDWQMGKVTFSRSVADWNESCTVRYNEVTIGEFQVHNNRNCFKFRFNISGLLDAGLLQT